MSAVHTVGAVVALAGLLFAVYTYLAYPLILWALGLARRSPPASGGDPDAWPTVSISVPAYNEEEQIEGLIQSLLALDYPPDKVQILIISDASTDRTDEIVRSFSDRGVELLRIPERGGKTRAENVGASNLRGEIVVNTDASIRIDPQALKALVSAFRDPAVGLASGRDVSLGPDEESRSNVGESGYVGYEMLVRELETRVSGIVGASGSLYGIRPELHAIPLPDALSRDFASALFTREEGYRAVSVPQAVCVVPRTGSLRREFRRKVRTIARGMETLAFKRNLLNPFRFGIFSWMLFSHKVCRWALPWVGLVVLLALALISPQLSWAAAVLLPGLLILTAGAVGWVLDGRIHLPRPLSIPAFLVAGNVAAMVAAVRVLRGDSSGTWEPTRRTAVERAGEAR